MATQPERHPDDALTAHEDQTQALGNDDPLLELARLLNDHVPEAPTANEPEASVDTERAQPEAMDTAEPDVDAMFAPDGEPELFSPLSDATSDIEPDVSAHMPERAPAFEPLSPESDVPPDLPFDDAAFEEAFASADAEDAFDAPSATVEPEQEGGEQPAAGPAPSLEDELAMLLGTDSIVPEQMLSPEPQPESQPDAAPFEAAGEADFWQQEAAEEAVAIDQVMPAFDDALTQEETPVQDSAEPVEDGPVPQWPFDAVEDTAPDAHEQFDAAPTAEETPFDPVPTSHPSFEPAGELTSSDIDLAFEEAFDAELSDFSPAAEPELEPEAAQPDPVIADVEPQEAEPALDPVDELAAIIGYEPEQPAPEANPEPEPEIEEDFGAAFESVLQQDLADTFDDPSADADATPVQDVPPALNTIDMSAYDKAGPTAFDVPDLDPDLAASPSQNAQSAPIADHDASNEGVEPFVAGAAAAGAFAAAGVAARAQGADQFEDELIRDMERDMEFVGHDLDTARQAAPEDIRDDPDAGVHEDDAGGSRRGMMIAGIVGAVAIVGIASTFLLAGGGSGDQANPVLVEADPDPVKIQPEDPGGTTVPNQDRAVFAADEANSPAQEQLVSTTEEPIDIASAPTNVLPPSVVEGEKSEDRLVEGGTETASEPSAAPITPRRVRTLIVRPDGTLEERPAAPEPAPAVVATAPLTPEPLAPQTPAVSETAPAPATAPVAGTSAAPATETQTAPAPAAPAAADTSSAPAETATAAPVSNEPVVRPVQTEAAAPAATPASPPLIRDRPADQPVNVVNRTNTQVAAAPAPAAPAPAPAAAAPAAASPAVTTGSTDGFVVQLAALPSEADARATATSLSQQYGGLIGSRGLVIQRADIEGRGTFYRVRVAANDRADANGLCNQIKSAGGNCFVAR